MSHEQSEMKHIAPNFLAQLDSPEHIALMYLTGELSAPERTTVEDRLKGDDALLSAMHDVGILLRDSSNMIERMESQDGKRISDSNATRRVARMMRQRQVDRWARIQPEIPPAGLRYPWWSYPLATAASLLIAFLVWWGNLDHTRIGTVAQAPSTSGQSVGTEEQEQALASSLERSLDISAELMTEYALHRPLDEAAEQLSALQNRSDDLESIYLNSTERTW